MTEEYLSVLECVLKFLQNHNQTSVDEIKPLAEPYWLNIKQYLLDHKIVSFPDGYKTVWVRTKFIDKCLEDIQIQRMSEKEQEKKNKEQGRKEIKRSVTASVISYIITAILCFVSGIFWERCSSDNRTKNEAEYKERHIDSPVDSLEIHNDNV